MESTKQVRDYDKDPIIIIDRMPEISLWTLATFFLIAVLLVFLFVPTAKNLDWEYTITYFTIMYGITFVFLKSKITKIRTITLYNEKIVRQWDERILEMLIGDVKEIKKSFLDFYDSRQKISGFRASYFKLLLPLYVFIVHPILISFKHVYKILHGFSNTSIFDTVVVFGTNEEMIAIFIPTNELKNELKEYFQLKGYDIDSLPIFYTNMYSPDEITHYLNKKDK